MNFNLHSQIVFIFACLFPQMYGFPDGAPASEMVCNTLSPKHGDLVPQKSQFPYTLSLNKNSIAAGGVVKLTISGNGINTFKGYLVQGRKVNYEKETAPVGTFQVDANDKSFHGLKCGDVENSSVTHSDNSQKQAMELNWIAPKEKGDYVILCTVVKDGATFWVQQPTQNITVT